MRKGCVGYLDFILDGLRRYCSAGRNLPSGGEIEYFICNLVQRRTIFVWVTYTAATCQLHV